MFKHGNKTPLWDVYTKREYFEPLNKNISTDICIIGLGGSGLSAALHASELGFKVTAIDSRFIAARAAGRNGGFLLNGLAKFYHETKKQIGAQKNKEIYNLTLKEIEWIKERIPGCVKETGVLRRAESSDEIKDCQEHLECLLQDGFKAEYYDGEQGSGILVTSDGVFDPVVRSVSLANLCLKNDVEIFNNTKAISISSNQVTTDYGIIESDLILVAIDGEIEKLFASLKDRVRPVRLQMCSTKPSNKKIDLPVYSNYGSDYWQQLSDGRVAIGGGRHIDEKNEYTDIMRTTEKIQNYLKNKLESIGIIEEVEQNWCGVVGYTNDYLPICEEIENNVWAVGGYNGTGNLIGPVLTKHVINTYKYKSIKNFL